MAHELTPSEYPNGELVDQWQSGGPDTSWDRRTYRTSDNLEKVLAFYENELPGFTQAKEIPGIYQARYVNEICDESWLSVQIARQMNEGRYPWYTEGNVPLPGVSIQTYTKSDNTDETWYEIWFSWPAL